MNSKNKLTDSKSQKNQQNQPKKPVVLQLVPRLEGGGVERVTLDMAGFLAQVDEVPTYVASEGGALVPELEHRGVQYLHLPIATKNPFKIIRNGFRLVEIVRELAIDVIHARSRAPAWSALIASKLTKIPFMTTYHGLYGIKQPFKTIKNLYNSVMVRGRCVVSSSSFVTGLIQKRHRQLHPKIVKIYPGIDVNGAFSPERYDGTAWEEQRTERLLSKRAFILLAIGRVVQGKRLDWAIRAMAALKKKYDNLYLIVAYSDQGHTDRSAELWDGAQDLGVMDRIRFIPDYGDIPLMYAISDLVLFPTAMEETYGRITAEGGAMGKIVIATDSGAVSELIVDGETGYVVPKDDFDTFVQRIEDVLALSQEDRLAMGERARKHIVANFNAERMWTETLKLYHAVAQDNLDEIEQQAVGIPGNPEESNHLRLVG
jgi:glycosyltransferase involved in cell wall biosynthesis